MIPALPTRDLTLPMSGNLAGKTAVVTGASRGIGRAIARKLAGAGCDIAGIYRNGVSLLQGVESMRRLQERFAGVAIEDHSKTFNTERVAALELGFMLDIAEAMLSSAARRDESRGAHQRIDFPARNDQRFLAHSLAYRTSDGSTRIEYLPVTITRWPPGERVYGEAAPHGGPNQAAGRTVPSGAGV